MEIAEGIDFIRENDQGVLATVRRDGSPQMSPNTFAVVNDQIIMSTRETAMKVHNLRRDPRCWLCAFPKKWLGKWYQLTCTAEVVSQPEAMDYLVEYYRTLRGEHPDWDEYRQAMLDDKRCVVRFTVESVGPTRMG